MRETQLEIFRWGRETFGTSSEIEILARCNIEVAELMSAVVNTSDPQKIAEEAADVYIVLCQFAERNGHILSCVPDSGIDVDEVIDSASLLNINIASLFRTMAIRPDSKSRMYAVHQYLKNCGVCLGEIFRILDQDMTLTVERKMSINRGREWTRAPHGGMQHV